MARNIGCLPMCALYACEHDDMPRYMTTNKWSSVNYVTLCSMKIVYFRYYFINKKLFNFGLSVMLQFHLFVEITLVFMAK